MLLDESFGLPLLRMLQPRTRSAERVDAWCDSCSSNYSADELDFGLRASGWVRWRAGSGVPTASQRSSRYSGPQAMLGIWWTCCGPGFAY